jgi:hypothetical protein
LQQYAIPGQGEPPATWRHWLFVIGVLMAFGLLCVLIVMGMIALVRWINHALWGM